MVKADRFQARLRETGISQSELARRVGVTQPTIYRLVHGKVYGSAHLHRIARVLGTTPAYLSGEVDDPQADAPPEPELSHDELVWVEYWRAMDADGRDAMVRVVKLLTGGAPTDRLHSPRIEYRAGAGR